MLRHQRDIHLKISLKRNYNSGSQLGAILPPTGYLAMSAGSHYGTSWVKDRDIMDHHAMYRTAPQNEELFKCQKW